MPRYTPQLKALKQIEFLNALEKTGSPKEAAKLVGRIGSQGALNPEHSAESMGTKRLKQVEESILEAALEQGVTPKKVAKEIKNLLDHIKPEAKDKGITHALKIGVGGGYAPEKNINFNVEVTKEEREAGLKALQEIN